MTAGAQKLVRMANQIAAEFGHQQASNAAMATWDHFWHFWDPRMRDTITAHLADGGEGLSPVSREAVRLLVRGGTPLPQTRATEFASDADGNTEGDAG